ncbi:hypothetical protein [Clostridium botulinum]|uniref:hypothetical protein n=1 Tax=Clostridium botulinum TaxID=1491 RepID=UPI000AC6803F|nr:hypothetical protein [Clostridium botulinum]
MAIYICTARLKPELIEEIISIGFDGMICVDGSYIEVDSNIFMYKKMLRLDYLKLQMK